LYVVAVIVAWPALTAVTLPESLTVTTDESDEDQVMVWLVAFVGSTAAVSSLLLPVTKRCSDPRIITPSVSIATTVTTQMPMNPLPVSPFTALGVISAVPGLIHVTMPRALTEATEGSDDDQVTA